MQNPPPYQQYGAPPQQPPTGKAPMGLEPDMFSKLCYAPCCIGLIVSIIGLIAEKNNRIVRFHSFQGLFIYVVAFALGIVLAILEFALASAVNGGGLLFLPIRLVVGLAFLGIAIFMMVKANGSEMTKLPLIGDMAANQAG